CSNADAANNQLFAPSSESELQKLLAQYPDAVLWAGGTDTGLWLSKQLRRLPVIVLLGGVTSLDFIEQTDAGIRIGATTCYADMMAVLSETWPAFAEVLRRTGSVQIRNAGTMGGNVANGSPIGDMAPMLIALNAGLRLVGPKGSRDIQVKDFFIAYGQQDLQASEYLHSIYIPKTTGLHFAAWKISKRFDQDISAVLGAFSYRQQAGKLADICIAFGGMAATPKRALATEAVLRGNKITAKLLDNACAALADDFTPLDDMRASHKYRMQVAGAILRKAFADEPVVYLAKAGADE
ncbi:Xanthine dehydrogenase iron-sulfur subunit / Xanthine dehydrogenase, FAD binding subunit, partial [hydrothermal vent metagenome]